MRWPADETALLSAQSALSDAAPALWSPERPREPGTGVAVVGASYVCFARGLHGQGEAGDPGWAAAARKVPGSRAITVVVAGGARGPYRPGLLALREGPLREAALRALSQLPDVVIVDAAGRDHPRRAGLAVQLGAVLDVPTVGATDRPLAAAGAWPSDRRGTTSPLRLPDGTVVGHWVRTRAGARPLAVSAGWRTDPDTAVEVVLAHARGHRTPQPMREARRAARAARAGTGS